MTFLRLVAFTLAAVLVAPISSAATAEAVYTARLADLPSSGALDVWIPLPVTRGPQVVTNRVIEGPYKWTLRSDAYGNEYAYTHLEPVPESFEVKVRFRLARGEQHGAIETTATGAEIRRATGADRLVTLSPRVRKLAKEITAGKRDPVEKARAIYDYLLATMTYDKTVPGWGKGDTERACDVHKGNCTDFHSLFMSLARANGIPARFVIGFPMSAPEKVVKGYHCWAEFWVEGKGWIPVDASDASKSSDPAVRDFLFGNLDAKRVQFTTGRDLELKPATAEPLNYFLYPYGEVAGKPAGVPSIELSWQ